jgi:hypothetical protein
MSNHDEIKSPRHRQEVKSRQTLGRTIVKYTKRILAAAGLFVATGAVGTAQADTTLYTSALLAGRLSCNAVNVSRKILTITISIIDGTGNEPKPLAVSDPMPTPPGLEVSNDYGDFTASASEGYCVLQVSGTGNRDDVRAALIGSTVAKRTTADGTTFPYYVTRVLQAY